MSGVFVFYCDFNYGFIMCFVERVQCVFFFSFEKNLKKIQIKQYTGLMSKKRKRKDQKNVDSVWVDDLFMMGVFPFKAPFTMLVGGPTCKLIIPGNMCS